MFSVNAIVTAISAFNIMFLCQFFVNNPIILIIFIIILITYLLVMIRLWLILVI